MSVTEHNNFPKLGINTAELTAAVEACIEEARLSKEPLGAVNWGDIGVTDIQYRLSMIHDEKPHIVVLIEEASPECELPAYIYSRLNGRFPNVYYECEW